MFGIVGLLAAIYAHFFIPESEVWLELKKNRAASQGDRAKSSVTVADLFKGGIAKITIVGTLLATFTLFAYWGINTWLPTFLVKERGLSPAGMSKFVLLMNLGMFIGYQVFGYVNDKIGRRKTLLICFIGATVMIPIYVSVQGQTLLFWMGPAMCVFYAFFGIFGSYFGELFPAEIRSLGAGFCFNIGRGLSALAPFILGFIATKYSLAAGIGFSAIFFVFAAIALLFLPETRKVMQ
jgi:MFS family permease